MSHAALETLKADELVLATAFLSTPTALRRALRRSTLVRRVRQALARGEITEQTIRGFVSGLLAQLHVGERFAYEIPLAALVVVLETRATDFADEFLEDLSRLQLAEMPLAIRVARECLNSRTALAKNMTRVIEVETGLPAAEFECAMASRFRAPPASQSKSVCQFGAG